MLRAQLQYCPSVFSVILTKSRINCGCSPRLQDGARNLTEWHRRIRRRPPRLFGGDFFLELVLSASVMRIRLEKRVPRRARGRGTGTAVCTPGVRGFRQHWPFIQGLHLRLGERSGALRVIRRGRHRVRRVPAAAPSIPKITGTYRFVPQSTQDRFLHVAPPRGCLSSRRSRPRPRVPSRGCTWCFRLVRCRVSDTTPRSVR
jgi:hypothetical protein